MSTKTARLTVKRVEKALGKPITSYRHNCHVASVALVRSDLFPYARVARGASTTSVMGQHSWVVLGHDCYASDAQIVDITLWSYDPSKPKVWVGSAADGLHIPHGSGSIWQYGKPSHCGGPTVELTPTEPLSPAARDFLDMIGPLDRRGWSVLIHAPVGGWPAGEIIAAIDDTKALSALIPVDVLGMITDRNPGGLYLKDAS